MRKKDKEAMRSSTDFIQGQGKQIGQSMFIQRKLKLCLISILVEFSSLNKSVVFHILRHRLLKNHSELASFP